nr:Chain T, Hybrid insulin peptide [Mus musculus]7Z50_W Chain W, Hybrid insulin peptide [Mus musculus]
LQTLALEVEDDPCGG